MTQELHEFALNLAKSSLCEVQLSIFLNKCKFLETKEEIIKLYKETRSPNKKQILNAKTKH